jgi:hypothetical protein
VVARWAHNPKVGGSNPPSATKKKPCRETAGLFCLKQDQACLRFGANKKARSSASALQGFFFVKHLLEDHEERSDE